MVLAAEVLICLTRDMVQSPRRLSALPQHRYRPQTVKLLQESMLTRFWPAALLLRQVRPPLTAPIDLRGETTASFAGLNC